ncbi:MAG: hypothetical protein V4510_04350 [bacterium]
MRTTLALLAIAAVCLPVVDAAPGLQNPAGPSPLSLFFHIADFQDFPINTQEPAKDFVAESGAGITTSSTSCLPPSPGGTGQAYHTLHGFSTPGFVEYQYIENNRPRFHPERGLSYDLELAGDTMTMHWYLSTQTGAPSAGGQDPDSAPIVMPQVVVAATMRTGEAIQIDGGGYDTGALIASGQSAPALLAGPASPMVSPQLNWTTVDGANVYEVTVPLHIAQHTIPKEGGFALRVDTYLMVPGPCSDPSAGYLMPNVVRVHSSPGFRPRLQLQLMQPIRIEYLHPQFVGEQLYLHTSANSPLGNYDVDANHTTIAISGPTAASSVYRGATVQRTHDHGAHTQPVDITFVWPFAHDGGAPGDYVVTMETWNDQHTAVARAEARFTLGDELQVTRCGGLNATEYAASHDGCKTEYQDSQGNAITPTQKAPSAGVLVVALLAGLAALARRR